MDAYGQMYDLGGHTFPVTTKSQEAQKWFDRGLLWTYGYNHEEAVSCFKKALEADPDCAMAHWGVGYASGPNYNMPWHLFDTRNRAKALAAGYESSQAALKLTNGLTDWEKALVEALPSRYPQLDLIDDMRPWNDDFADAMREAYQAYADSLEVQAIFAEALLNRTPWKMWDLQSGEPAEGASTKEAQKVLEAAMARAAPGGKVKMAVFSSGPPGMNASVASAGHLVAKRLSRRFSDVMSLHEMTFEL